MDKTLYWEYVLLSIKEYDKLISNYWDRKAQEYIERLEGYALQIWEKRANNKYKSHYHTILNWLRRDKVKIIDNKPLIISDDFWDYFL